METSFAHGLLPLKADDRDYSHHAAFGTLGAASLPTDDFTVYDSFQYTIKWGDTLSMIAQKFGVTISAIAEANHIENINRIRSGTVLIIPSRTPMILNQLDLDFCTAFATATLQYLLFGTPIDPFFQFAKIKEIRGEWAAYGADLRDTCASVIKFGSLNAKMAPYTHSGAPTDKIRDFLANWSNYPSNFDIFAKSFKDQSYFNVDGVYDTFDNIRSCLAIHRQERRAVTFGLIWHPEWTEAKGGIIPDIMPTSQGGGHDMVIVGQKKINGQFYLDFQQSWGENAGDKGHYYFPRSIVNQCALQGYGKYTFSRVDSSGMKVASSILGFLQGILGKIKIK